MISKTTAKTQTIPDGPVAEQVQDSAPRREAVGTEQPEDQTIGGVIRHFRERLEMSQKDFSKAMGFSSAEWCGMVESGVRKIDIDRVARAAQVLKINPKDLTLLALSQYYPNAYRMLFGTGGPAMPEGKETPVTLLPETYEHALVYDSLPPHERGIVTLVTKALAKSNKSTMHVSRK